MISALRAGTRGPGDVSFSPTTTGLRGTRRTPKAPTSNSSGHLSALIARLRRSWEPWRDWAALTLVSQGTLLLLAVLRPAWPWVIAAGLVLGITWASATLIVLHDAGHRRLARRTWPNVLAVHTAVPAGFWVEHWTRKHRVHHRLTQVYPLDEPTRASGMVRLHPQGEWRPVHRYQHMYAWFLYGLAWAGELRSQIVYLRSGDMAGTHDFPVMRRALSFTVDKLICAAILVPYAIAMGGERFTLMLLVTLTVASVSIAVITAVGHINVGLVPEPGSPTPDRWMGHIVATTASFSTASPAIKWITGAMTHHLAHHLRPVAPRAELDALHRDLVPVVAAKAGEDVVEFASLAAAVRGHWLRLKELGQPGGYLTDDGPLVELGYGPVAEVVSS